MSDSNVSKARQRRRRSMLWSLALILVLSIALPLGYALAQSGGQGVQQQQQQRFGQDRATNPRSDMWREAREGQGGFTTQTGPYVTNTMISNVGETWRQFRMGPLITYGGYLLIGALALVALVFTFVGRIKLAHGRAGMTIERWKPFERYLHWFTATTFIVLAITGLSLLFGRTVLIPVMGHQAFAAWADIGKVVHNYVGPAFSVAVLLMILMWVKHNMPKAVDLKWFAAGGGIFGKSHPSAGKFNGGEKVWFWVGIVVFGIMVSVSGFLLNFPLFGQTRADMALYQAIHAITSLLWIAFFFGHAYIGTLGTEGALEGMTTGRVDVNWAKQHHDLWYEDEIAKGVKPQQAEAPATGSVGTVGQPSH
ncbi:MAG TPA: formate dehydrogenase subunit gamma [Azoarcus taiwanensis]|nr:formate dehydrogenase subunit gamma [Azoarcus taiwanensis]